MSEMSQEETQDSQNPDINNDSLDTILRAMLTSPLVGCLQVAGRQPLIGLCPSLASRRRSKLGSAWILVIMAASQYSLALQRCNAHWPKQV